MKYYSERKITEKTVKELKGKLISEHLLETEKTLEREELKKYDLKEYNKHYTKIRDGKLVIDASKFFLYQGTDLALSLEEHPGLTIEDVNKVFNYGWRNYKDLNTKYWNYWTIY